MQALTSLKTFRLTFLILSLVGIVSLAFVYHYQYGRDEFDSIELKFGKVSGDVGSLTFLANGIAVLETHSEPRVEVPFDVVQVQRALAQFRKLASRQSVRTGPGLEIDLCMQLRDQGQDYQCRLGSSIVLSNRRCLAQYLGLEEWWWPSANAEDITMTFMSQAVGSIRPTDRKQISEVVQKRSCTGLLSYWLLNPIPEGGEDRPVDGLSRDERAWFEESPVWQTSPQKELMTPKQWIELSRSPSPDNEFDAVLVSRSDYPFGDARISSSPVWQTNFYVVPHGQPISAEKPYNDFSQDKYVEEAIRSAVFVGFEMKDVSVRWRDNNRLSVDMRSADGMPHKRTQVEVTHKGTERRIRVDYNLHAEGAK